MKPATLKCLGTLSVDYTCSLLNHKNSSSEQQTLQGKNHRFFGPEWICWHLLACVLGQVVQPVYLGFLICKVDVGMTQNPPCKLMWGWQILIFVGCWEQFLRKSTQCYLYPYIIRRNSVRTVAPVTTWLPMLVRPPSALLLVNGKTQALMIPGRNALLLWAD